MRYRIASFNMKKFGFTSQKDFDKIAEIITEEQFDVVALQEIFSEGKGVSRFLEECVKYNLYDWDFCFGLPSESNDISKNIDMINGNTRGEGYAYLWNKRKFKLLEFQKLGKKRTFEPRIINSMSNDVNINTDVFARTPYYIRLQPIYGGFFEIRLINIHIYFGSNSLVDIEKRRIEYELLTQSIYPEISQKRYGQNRIAYTVAMGDYNLNLYSPYTETQSKNCYVSQVYSYREGKRDVDILTVQDKLTTLGESGSFANNYDHFTYSPDLSFFQSVSYDRVDAVNKYCNGDYEYYNTKISDHLPVVMTVEI